MTTTKNFRKWRKNQRRARGENWRRDEGILLGAL